MTQNASAADLEEPVAMCSTGENTYWCHGWVDKGKFRGQLLSRASDGAFGSLDGEESPSEIIKGKVRHGWVLTVIGDTSGCGWDMTMHFEVHEPVIVVEDDGTKRWQDDDALILEYDDEDNESEVYAELADGPHKATWWES